MLGGIVLIILSLWWVGSIHNDIMWTNKCACNDGWQPGCYMDQNLYSKSIMEAVWYCVLLNKIFAVRIYMWNDNN